MVYCCCKQTVRGGRPTALQRLGRGSVICFGSTIDHAFCVDTVFVVASAEPWTAADAADLDLDEAFRVCTAEAIVTWQDLDPGASGCGPGESVPFTLSRGATVDDPVDGMFSFVPARRADAGPQAMRFARPAVELPGWSTRPAGRALGAPTDRCRRARRPRSGRRSRSRCSAPTCCWPPGCGHHHAKAPAGCRSPTGRAA